MLWYGIFFWIADFFLANLESSTNTQKQNSQIRRPEENRQ